MVLYRKYRPQVFKEVVGQDHIREPLLAQLTKGTLSHAYLFTGPRGTGKTSVARILAKAVNCEEFEKKEKKNVTFGEPCNVCESCSAVAAGNHLDLIEIDAASNRGIDEIRDLRERIRLSPARGRYKVFIIDEAHMLTPEAFNALLKTLEEPPEHVIFVLATTEPQKIPATIASRTSQFDFKVPTIMQIKEKLQLITKNEGWELSEEVLEEAAKQAGGAFRDAEVLLEKIAAVDPKANVEKALSILGKQEVSSTINLLSLIEQGKTKEALVWLNEYLNQGGSIRILTESFLETLRKILLIKAGAESILDPITEEEKSALKNEAPKISKSRILELANLFNRVLDDLRDATIPQLPLELAVVEATLTNSEQEIPLITEPDKAEEAATNKPGIKKEEEKERTEGVGIKEEENVSISHDKKAGSDDKTLKKLQKDWGEFLKRLKPLNSSLEMFLRAAKPTDIDEDLLTIEFAYRFHKEKVEEKKYREIVEKVLGGFTGGSLRIKGTVSQKPPETKKETPIEDRPKKEDMDPVEIFSKLE